MGLIEFCDFELTLQELKAPIQYLKADIVDLLKLSTVTNYCPAVSVQDMHLMTRLYTDIQVLKYSACKMTLT